ncbi:right-handed parallel beta-helix repeat-containing protein [Candidatus Hydrogenedentota bacterium]
MKSMIIPTLIACFLSTILVASAPATALTYSPPNWGTPTQTVRVTYNAGNTEAQNGAVLEAAIEGASAGQHILVDPGAYYIGQMLAPNFPGTQEAPILIEPSGAGEVIIKNPPSKNVMDLDGSYAIIRRISFTEGSAGIRIHSAHHIWIDQCHIHNTDEAGITTNTQNTNNIYITNNEIDHTGGYGEGMYLGANNGGVIMNSSYIVGNYVHHTNSPGIVQGDGIELKQGSWGNLIARNTVHDCKYPCILVYGTDGQPQNVVEENICWNSGDNVMQVQGEAIVRNNLLMSGAGSALASQDHQGTVTNLQIVNNTIINSGRAVRLQNWGGKTNMVFANNAAYSQNSDAVFFSGGSAGVTFEGNVCAGNVSGVTGGYVSGGTLAQDFQNVSYDATQRHAKPELGSTLVGAADPAYMPPKDLTGSMRTGGPITGAYDLPDTRPLHHVPVTSAGIYAGFAGIICVATGKFMRRRG